MVNAGYPHLMIRSFAVRSEIQADALEFRRVLSTLRDAGWFPAGLAAEIAFASDSGVDEQDVIADSLRDRTGSAFMPAGPEGDVFFIGSDIYCLFLVDEPLDDDPDPRPYLEAILVTDNPDDPWARVAAFADAISRAVGQLQSGANAAVAWAAPPVERSRLRDLQDRIAEEGVDVRFDPASLESAEMAAAEALADFNTRELARTLSRAGFARERDLQQRPEPGQDKRLYELAEAGVIATEYLLECRSTSRPLTRLEAAEQMHEDAIKVLRCPSCNRRFADENLARGYSLSHLGKRMIQSSSWMAVWVTKALVELGVPEDAILLNLEDSGEEVDLLVEVGRELWIFELKDREFGAGDAHALNYRRVRYRAEKTIVVTTEKVAPDAKRVFADLAKESEDSVRRTRGRRRRAATSPTYIEGLSQVPPKLHRELSDAALREVRDVLRLISLATGFDVGRILDLRIEARRT